MIPTVMCVWEAGKNKYTCMPNIKYRIDEYISLFQEWSGIFLPKCKAMFLYSALRAVSSPFGQLKALFTFTPDRPVHSGTNSAYL